MGKDYAHNTQVLTALFYIAGPTPIPLQTLQEVIGDEAVNEPLLAKFTGQPVQNNEYLKALLGALKAERVIMCTMIDMYEATPQTKTLSGKQAYETLPAAYKCVVDRLGEKLNKDMIKTVETFFKQQSLKLSLAGLVFNALQVGKKQHDRAPRNIKTANIPKPSNTRINQRD